MEFVWAQGSGINYWGLSRVTHIEPLPPRAAMETKGCRLSLWQLAECKQILAEVAGAVAAQERGGVPAVPVFGSEGKLSLVCQSLGMKESSPCCAGLWG